MTPAVIVPDLSKLDLDQSQPVIYDRPIGLRLLHQDSDTGAEHYVVRYPKGMKAIRHTHTAAHSIVVIDGALTANGQRVRAGSYLHFPAGTVMHHEPAPGTHCLFITIFDGPFDVHPA